MNLRSPQWLTGIAAFVCLWVICWFSELLWLRVCSALAVLAIWLWAIAPRSNNRPGTVQGDLLHVPPDSHSDYDQILQAISLQRHEWMNDIQLLFGYVQMKKWDKLKDHVEWIKEKAAQESKLFKLGVPHLIVYLYTFEAASGTMKLEVELEQEIHLDELDLDVAPVAASILKVVDLFARSSSAGSDNCMTLIIYSEDGSLFVQFEFTGNYDLLRIRREYQRWFGTKQRQEWSHAQSQEHPEWATLTLQFPYRSSV